jgi:hypothetical protein
MGYRSQVVLAVGKEVMPHFLAALSQEPSAKDLVFDQHDELIKDFGEPGGLLVKWDHIKWYPSYPDVAKIQSFVECPSDYGPDTVEGTDPEEFFRFVRAGEESSDNEEHGGGFEIYISRTIEY